MFPNNTTFFFVSGDILLLNIRKTNLKTTMKIKKKEGYQFVNFGIDTLKASTLRAYFSYFNA
jgi:hypothetical protein